MADAWIQWRGAEAGRLAREAQYRALNGVARRILAEAKKQVPLDEGDLSDSGKLMRSRAREPTVRIRFGGPEAEYAVKWHEIPSRFVTFQHGRKRRYLADPFNAIAPTYPDVLRQVWPRVVR